MRNRRIAAIVLAVAVAGLTVAATTASARPQQTASDGHDGEEGRGRRRLPRRVGVVVRLHRRLRPDRRVPRRGVRHLLEPARAHARRLQPRRRCSRATCSCPTSPPTLGVVTNGGKTYTFKLKHGIKFGPPLNRAITSKDILFAFERIGTKSIGAQYGFYYDAIKGMTAFSAGKSKVISGIKTPDPKTIIFTLTKPTGDFRYRLSMPAAGPHAAGGRGLLHEAERVRPLRHLVGPVHDRRLGQAQRVELRHDQGRRRHLGLRRREDPRPRPQPRLQPRDGQPRRRARTSPTSSPSRSTRTRTTSTRRSPAATSRKRSPARRRPSSASTRARRSSTRTTATAPGTSR